MMEKAGKEKKVGEKESCTIKFTETDGGFRLDVSGKNLKMGQAMKSACEAMCCKPMFGCEPTERAQADCSSPGEDKK
jgi:hypothetical protein